MNEFTKKIDSLMLNGSDLAYIGDAYYELYIRTYLISKGIHKPNELHSKCTKYVCAKSHALIASEIVSEFTPRELDVFHRGKNYNYKHTSKSANLPEYLLSSGFEAVIGYLFISQNEKRLNEILAMAISIIERN